MPTSRCQPSCGRLRRSAANWSRDRSSKRATEERGDKPQRAVPGLGGMRVAWLANV